MNKRLPGMLITIVGVFASAIVFGMKKNIVIYTHYSTWRVLTIISIAAAALGIVMFIIGFLKDRSEAVKKIESEADSEFNRQRSIKLKNPEDIKKFYREMNDTPVVMAGFTRLVKQLDEIEEHKRKLTRLMEINDLEIFGNTRELLDRIEDYLCSNCRKAVNNYIVDEDDKGELVRSVELLAEDNSQKLLEVKNFLDQLRDYANSQGEDEEAVETLRVYCNTIRKSVS